MTTSGSDKAVSRSEAIDVIDGKGRLQVRGTTAAFGLFVDNHPVAANWYDCEGSIGQYFYRLPNCSLEQSAALVREAVRDALPPDRALAASFWPLLNQFAPGAYRLDYDEAGPGLRFWEVNYTSDSDATPYAHHYANELRFDHVLLPTQRTDPHDDCMLNWAIAIEAGQRPTIITTMLEGADSEFILDGHHKFAAYNLVGVPARRLAIVPLNPHGLQLADWPGGALADPPESWPKALALRPRTWPHDAEPPDARFEYQRRAEFAQRLGLPVPNLFGCLEASYVYLYDYSPNYREKEFRGWIMSPAKLELLESRAEVGSDGCDIIKVAVISSRTSSGPDLVGWVPLIATSFTEYFDPKSRTVEFQNRKLL